MIYLRALLVFACFTCVAAAEEGGWEPLWNGKDLSGWESWLGKPHASITLADLARDEGGNVLPLGAGRDPLGVFTVVEVEGQPAIRISGQIFGTITTTREFSNYHLKLQFKWGETKYPPRANAVRDSGLLYHVHSAMNFNKRVWPRSIELQIQEHDTGDLYAIGAQITVNARRPDPEKRLFIYDPQGEPTQFVERLPIGNRCVKDPDNEKPTGEWNTVELVCMGDQSIHIVNGKVVMRLREALRLDGETPVPLTKGPIALQAEGAEIFFRGVMLRPITAIPAEFAEK